MSPTSYHCYHPSINLAGCRIFTANRNVANLYQRNDLPPTLGALRGDKLPCALASCQIFQNYLSVSKRNTCHNSKEICKGSPPPKYLTPENALRQGCIINTEVPIKALLCIQRFRYCLYSAGSLYFQRTMQFNKSYSYLV